MKRFITLSVVVLLMPLLAFNQEISNLDFISPFHEGLAAVQKGDAWGFIDTNGVLVIHYRTDLVLKEINNEAYPVFSSGRCLIQEERDGILYFGYIDRTGAAVIPPQFLNATHFNEGLAIVLELYKNVLGQNDVLDKNMISYSYGELAINPSGDTIHYLFEEPTHITLAKDFMDGPPEIKSVMLTKSLFAVKNKKDKWSLKKV